MWKINSFSQPFPPTALRCHHAQTVGGSSSSYKIDYVIVIQNFLNPKGHQIPSVVQKLRPISLKGWILPIGVVASGRVCACILRSRLVYVRIRLILCIYLYCIRIRMRRGIHGQIWPFAWKSCRGHKLRLKRAKWRAFPPEGGRKMMAFSKEIKSIFSLCSVFQGLSYYHS